FSSGCNNNPGDLRLIHGSKYPWSLKIANSPRTTLPIRVHRRMTMRGICLVQAIYFICSGDADSSPGKDALRAALGRPTRRTEVPLTIVLRIHDSKNQTGCQRAGMVAPRWS